MRGVGMTRGGAIVGLLALAALAGPSRAQSYESEQGTNGCDGDGGGCIIRCYNGDVAGVMYFNGSTWSDGVRSGSFEEVAYAILEANGTYCVNGQ